MKNLLKNISATISQDFPLIAAMPALIWQAAFSIVPLFAMFVYSILGTEHTKNFLHYFTFDFYSKLFNYTYLKVIVNSLALAFGTILGCLLFCFTAAYAIVFFVRRKHQPAYLILMMLPLWTNFIVRIYSWFFLLDKRGVLSMIMVKLGVIDRSTQFLFNPITTAIGMIYCYYPFMLLPLYMAMSSIKTDILEASADLGADTLMTLRMLIIPSCLSEIVFSSGVIGLMAFGEFAIPQLLGGSKYSFWGSVIHSLFMNQHDFKTGAAFTFVGLITIGLVCFVVYLLWIMVEWLKHYRCTKSSIYGEQS